MCAPAYAPVAGSLASLMSPGRLRVRIAVCATALVGLLACAPAAPARDTVVTSFDGTRIVTHFFPAANLRPGAKAPTVLFGPGWAQAGENDPESESEGLFGSIGPGPLRRAGYNVLTWDPRGFGQSGGVASADGPEKEGRDVQVLLSFVAGQPESLNDAPGDPRVGMTGASYGGGIQLVVAGIDARVDAIVPDIAWHSFGTALYKDSTFKQGWGNVLFGAGLGLGTLQGLVPAAGQAPTADSLDPHITSAYAEASATGRLSPENYNWFLSRGPGDLVNRIDIPTLFTQGSVDTLFTLQESITNYAILRRNGVPTKLLWFCGGHGACLTPPGDAGRIERAALAWLARYLKRNPAVNTGPAFEWLDQTGAPRTGADYPLAGRAPLVAGGAGTLALAPAPSGLAIAATRAPVATEVTFASPPGTVDLIGEPRVTLSYSGTAANPDAKVYGQLVDNTTSIVLGNQTTPIPLTLDGQPHTVTRPLEPIAHSYRPGQTITLQITPSSNVYDGQRTTGAVTFSAIRAELPVVDAAATPPGYGTGPAGAPTGGRGRARLRLGVVTRLNRPRVGTIGVVVSTVGGRVRNVVLRVRTRRGSVLGTRRLPTFSGTRRLVVRLNRRLAPGTYTLEAAGRSGDGSLARTARRFVKRLVR